MDDEQLIENPKCAHCGSVFQGSLLELGTLGFCDDACFCRWMDSEERLAAITAPGATISFLGEDPAPGPAREGGEPLPGDSEVPR